MKEDILVTIDNVSFSYDNELVLDNINLEIKRGDFLGLIGPNGSGKTTLLRIILGLLPLQQGRVQLFGKAIQQFKDWNRIGYVPQKVINMDTPNFDSSFPITVEEVVQLGRVMQRGMFQDFNKEDHQAVTDALEEVGLTAFLQTPISKLSGGQQQRVFIAKALASDPELLILDEPTVGVDVEAQDRFYEELSKLNRKRQLTMILVSHDIDVVVNEVNKLACLNKRLIYHGGPSGFIRGNYLEKLYGKQRRFVLHGH